MALTVTHTKHNNVADWTQPQLDTIIAGGAAPLPPAGTVLADVTLPSDWNANHTITGSIDVANGGTGNTSYTIGDLLYASGTTTLSKLADVATGNALISGGVGVAPSWGKIGLTTHVSGILPLANGGTGLSNTRTTVTTSGTITAQAVASTFLVFTAGNVDLQGMVAQADGTEVTLYSSNCNLVVYHGSGGATAANRFELPNAASIVIPYNTGSTFRYYGTISRWVLVGGYGYVSSSRDGILSAAQYNTFNAKPSGSGSTNAVTYWSSPGDLGYNSGFGFNPTSVRLGVGVTVDDQEATGHFKSDVATTIANPSGFVVTQTLWNPISTPTGSGASAIAPNLARPDSLSASINYSGSGYIANGQTIDYIILPAYDDFMGTITYGVAQSASFTAGADDNSGNPYEISVSWGVPSSNVYPNYWVSYRQINGGGFTEWRSTGQLTPDFIDNNAGWSAGGPSISATYPDFLANGSNNFSYSAYGRGLTPISTDVFSSSADGYMFTDPNDGSAFLIGHSGNSSDNVRVTDGSNHFDVSAGTPWTFTQTANNLTSGSTVTPNTYGYLSNGSTLNISYDLYSYDTVNAIYSSGSTNQTTTDPNDGQYYYNILQPTTPDGGKIIKDSSTGLFVTTAGTYYDDGVTTFPDSTTVTPTSTYVPTVLAESHGSSLSDKAGMISRSLDGTYSRFEFQDNTGVRKGYLEQDTSNLTVQGGGGAYLQFHNSANVIYGNAVTALQLDSTSLTFNASVGGGGALAYTGTNKLTWVGDGIRVCGANTGYRAGLEVQASTNSFPTVAIKQRSGQTSEQTLWLDPSNGVQSFVTSEGRFSVKSLILQAATSSTPPLKFASASLVTAAAGGVEFLTDKYYATITTGTARKELTLNDAALTAGRVPFVTTNGRLTDDADMTFATDTLTVTKLVTSTSITNSGLTAGRVTFAGTGGLLTDDADLTFATDTLTATKLATTLVQLTGDLTFLGTTTRNITTPASASSANPGTSLNITTGAGFAVGNGSLATDGGILAVTTGAGGAATTSGASPNAAGTGANITLTSGAGGAVGGSAAFNQSANGGAISITTGAGGALVGGLSGESGGTGGTFQFLAGTGGATNTTATLGGSGGSISSGAGTGGAGTVSGATGGNGGNTSFSGGVGGASTTAGSATNTGGNGGSTTLAGGAGGAGRASSTSNIAGAGGVITLVGGSGGSSTSGAGTRVGGNGGAANITGGTGGTGSGTPGNGGSVYIVGGAPGSGGVNGDVYLGQTSGGTARGTIIAARPLRLKGYTVATLPAGTQGDTAFVTDALAPTYLTALVGGGAVVTPCFYDGTNWVAY